MYISFCLLLFALFFFLLFSWVVDKRSLCLLAVPFLLAWYVSVSLTSRGVICYLRRACSRHLAVMNGVKRLQDNGRWLGPETRVRRFECWDGVPTRRNADAATYVGGSAT